jgi:hypothetical protein
VNTADDIKRLAGEYANFPAGRAARAREELHTAIDALAGERDALLEALRYGVDIHTPGRTDGPQYHHMTMWLNQASAAIKKCEEPK